MEYWHSKFTRPGAIVKPTALVIGASGFLGSNVLLSLLDEFDCVAHSSSLRVESDLYQTVTRDLCITNAGIELVQEVNPSLVINCAALADVEICENNYELALRLNAIAPGELATGCERVGARFVHVSTDAVYSSTIEISDPHTKVNPINNYGRTKAEGEIRVLEASPSSAVVRTNIVGWSPTRVRSLFEFVYNALSQNQLVHGFQDSYFRPVSASNFWPIVRPWVFGTTGGIYHAFSSQLISKYDFCCRVASVFGFDTNLITPVDMSDNSGSSIRSKTLNLRPTNIDDVGLIDIELALEQLYLLSRTDYRERLRRIITSSE